MAETTNTLLEIVGHIIKKHPTLSDLIIDRVLPGFSEWRSRGFEVPCPKHIKDGVLLRRNIPKATWIETGTYLGDTTQLLAQISSSVISIEPDLMLFERAKDRFSGCSNIHLINGISEEILPNLLTTLSGSVCFWLDGHYSGEGTFAGPNDTLLLSELKAIGTNIQRFESVVLCIDDIRLCGKTHSYGEYPSLNDLVLWCVQHNLNWSIEYDIFIGWR